MSTTAEVRLWGKTIGAVSLENKDPIASFEYDSGFVQSGIEVAPLTMPLSNQIYRFPTLSTDSFHGLPGMLADSLPDKFGNALIDTWLAKAGRTPASFNAVERLCYTGTRGMGALEYKPTLGPRLQQPRDIQIDRLVNLASEILSQRKDVHLSFHSARKEEALREILRVGTSAGGARAKAVIAWNPETNVVQSGQVKTGPGFQHWLIKFDGIQNNRDRELADPEGYGIIEFAYYQMAIAAGLKMATCRLFKESDRQHFMTRRFDRDHLGKKIHTLSLGGMAHFNYKTPEAHSYEQVFGVMHQIKLPTPELEQFFRRMVFNIVARNQDDHVKNISFLMNKQGIWTLSPAYDVTYSYNPDGQWTGRHQLSLNGKRDGFTFDDFQSCAGLAMLKHGQARKIVNEVTEVVKGWHEFADAAGVNQDHRDRIQRVLRLDIGIK